MKTNMNIDSNVLHDLENCIYATIKLALGSNIEKGKIQIMDCGVPHSPTSLPEGKMAVYTFFYKNECLKIGKAGPNSNARYLSQHYNPKSSQSNLAKSLLADEKLPIKTFNEENIGDWIKQNIRRINILVDKDLNIYILNLIEAFAQLYFHPRYEGFDTQIK
jgi:hypothetical protein